MTARDKLGYAFSLLNWTELCRRYMPISRPYFALKLNGNVHQGILMELTEDETRILQSALKDIAVKIYSAAENLDK